MEKGRGGGGGWMGRGCTESQRGVRRRRSDWEGGEASELSAGLFSKHTAESLQLIHSLLFLELLCLPVWPYNIIHLVYRFFFFWGGGVVLFLSGTRRVPPLGSNSSRRSNIKAPRVWAEAETASQKWAEMGWCAFSTRRRRTIVVFLFSTSFYWIEF